MEGLLWKLRSLLKQEIFVEFFRQITLRQIAEIKGRPKSNWYLTIEEKVKIEKYALWKRSCKNGQHHFKISRYVLLLTKGSRHNDSWDFRRFRWFKASLPDWTLFSNFIRSKKLNCTTKTKQNIVQKVVFKLGVSFTELVGIRLSSGGPPSM